MTRYFKWLMSLIGSKDQYRTLMMCLFAEKYTWDPSFPTDSDRAEDGIGLRFSYFYIIGKRIDVLEAKPCSVLEMLIALSLRADNDIYGTPGEPHPELLFWEMIHNAGLDIYVNDRFNENAVTNIIDNILSRRFRPNGVGGFFPIAGNVPDQRCIPIWDQMNYYLVSKDCYEGYGGRR